MDISLDIESAHTIFYICVGNILIYGTVSQIFYLGLSFYFMTKKGNFCYFLPNFAKFISLYTIKQKLKPKSEF